MRKDKVDKHPTCRVTNKWEAFDMLGRATHALAKRYPHIKDDVYRRTPERQACEIIIACKDLVELT